MLKDDIEQQLRRAALDSNMVRVQRRSISRGELRGFPLRVESGLMLLRVCEDFRVDGWAVLPITHVTSLERDAVESFDESALKADGLWDDALTSPPLDMSSLDAVVRCFAGKSELISLQDEVLHPDELIVGRIYEAYSTAIVIREANRIGGWDDDTTAIPLSSITQLRFGGHYLDTQARHCSAEPELMDRSPDSFSVHDAPLSLVDSDASREDALDGIRAQLAGFMERGEYCRLERTFPGTLNHRGHVLHLGKEHVALERYHDFHSEGASLIRLQDITNVSTDVQDRWIERVIETEGLRLQLPPASALKDFPTLLAWAKKRDALLILELESDDEEDDEFYLGRVVELGADSLDFLEMDTEGEWFDEVCEIALTAITRIEVSSPYVAMYAKYGAGFPTKGD